MQPAIPSPCRKTLPRLLAWPFALACGVMLAGGTALLTASVAEAQEGVRSQRQEPTTVRRGARLMGPFQPQEFRGDLRDLPRAKEWKPGDPIRTIPRRATHRDKYQPPGEPINPVLLKQDPLLDAQASAPAGRSQRMLQSPSLNIAGQPFSGVYPPDTVGDVGKDHYIQMVNSSGGSAVTIYNKGDGSVAAGPLTLDGLWTNGGDCAAGLGDPVVLYDPLAERWLLSEFTNTGNRLCIYVSKGPNPVTSGWYLYNIVSELSFPDYPKYAVWPDAYYITTNEDSPTVYALDRSSMLAGGAVGMQFFSAAPLDGFQFQTLTPADLDGTAPPPTGAPGLMIRHRDDEVHNAGANNPSEDYLELFEFHVDWTTPANSSLTGPAGIPVSEFDSSLCGLTSYQCFPQPGTSYTLDPVREVVMWRLAYRNFGGYQSLVGNLTTDVNGADRGGIRWFELRRSGTAPWALHQEGTYAPDNANRWMGSIAQDNNGNIALGYSVGSSSIYPGIRYTGRLASDPLGTLTQGEISLHEASYAQSASNRWGDYSSMAIDPVDGCTFWYTNEYGETGGKWGTRIGSFRFQECGEPGFFLESKSNLDQAVCAGSSLSEIDLLVQSVAGYSNPVTLSLVGSPGGFLGGFSVNPVTPTASSAVTIAVGSGVTAGDYSFEIGGTGSGATSQQIPVTAHVYNGLPGSASLLAPANGAVDQPVRPTFTWDSVAGAREYRIDIASDTAFTQLVDSARITETTYTPSVSLAPGAPHFWRVVAINPCGSAAASNVYTLTTLAEYCRYPAISIPDDNPTGVSDTLTIADTRTIQDLDLRVQATHSYPGDLIFTLTHAESGVSVTLIDRPGEPASLYGCGKDNIDAILDDEASTDVESTCAATPPAIGGNLRPNNPLSGFDTQTLAGAWTLKVSDNSTSDTGHFDAWCLHPTFPPPVSPCDGASVVYENATIPAGSTVTCNAGDITVQNVTVEGTLNINKSGKANLKPTVRTVPPVGTLNVRQAAP